MVCGNGKGKAQGAWRDQEVGRNSNDSNSYKRIRCPSRTTRHQPFRTSRKNWKKFNFTKRPGGNTSGKIVDQLIEETRQQLAHHAEQVEKLTERLQELEALEHQLTRKTE